MGRADLIGNGKQHLIPTWQPATEGGYQSARRKNSTPPGAGAQAPALPSNSLPKKKLPAQSVPAQGRILTQHTGLPPRAQASPEDARKRQPKSARAPRRGKP